MAHTPGPWTFKKIRPDGGGLIFAPDGRHIATIFADDSYPEAVGANANAIAAVPEMLDAARNASRALRAIAAIANDLPRGQAARIHAAMPFGYGELDAAIAKATGA